jgi:nickel/cobalt transporter (NicO) family protein
MPEPSQLEGPWSWTKAISLAMTVGIRPCTGAILVMLFALSQGLLWAGIFATFMMSFGTALTVSALAALAVGSRDLALRLTGKESAWAGRLETAIGIGGALFVVLLGVAGFITSLTVTSPF